MLVETLALWRKTKFVWGETDCLLSVADYIVANGGADGGKAYRGKYHDQKSANKIVESAGGFEELIDATGIARTETPKEGDVCTCILLNRPVAGLHTLDSVAFRQENKGVVEISKRFIKVVQSWSIESCHQ